jgi:hypothetical protein
MPAWGPILKIFWTKYGIKAGFWLLRQIGLETVLKKVEAKLDELGDRRRAIRKARHTRDGGWAPVIVEGRTRFVVYSGKDPVEIMPAISGDIAKAMNSFDRSRLRTPDDVATARFKAWATRRWRKLEEDVTDGSETVTSPAGSEEQAVREAVEKSQEAGGTALFDAMVETLPDLLTRLTAADGKPVADHAGIPEKPGVYFFSEGVNPVYVGQSRNLRQRLRQHTAPSARENQAALAWQIALKAAREDGHPVAGTRKDLEADESFAEHFREAKKRVRQMDSRFIEIDDPVTRTVFEVYAARALDTGEFNSWETH